MDHVSLPADAQSREPIVAAYTDLLGGWRAALRVVLAQQRAGDAAQLPAEAALTLVQARGEIGRIKALLRGWGEVVADLPDDQEIANPEDVAQQLRLLDAFRRRLAVQLRQAAQFAERDRPPHLAADIDDAREHIRQIKAQLRAWQAPVADTAEDAG